MGAVSRMSKHFRFSGKIVGYAGTKDKRGVTAQWCTVRKKSIEELRTFNRPLGAHQVRPHAIRSLKGCISPEASVSVGTQFSVEDVCLF